MVKKQKCPKNPKGAIDTVLGENDVRASDNRLNGAIYRFESLNSSFLGLEQVLHVQLSRIVMTKMTHLAVRVL